MMLKIFEPKILDTARSTALMRSAATLATISGSDVVIAKKIVPTKLAPKPVLRAI